MFRRFLEEEEAQTAIEYMMIAGGVMVAAVVLIGVYSGMTRSAATQLNASVGEKVGVIANTMNNTAV